MKTLIQAGRLINPTTQFDGVCDIWIESDKILEVTPCGARPKETANTVVDASGCLVTPGWIDLHVHLREPGFEHKETIYTGSRACAKGGYTTVACMPNTNPVMDRPERILALKEVIQRDAVIEVLPVGAITEGLMGKALTAHADLFKAGAVALSDDGKTTMSETFMAEALKSARAFGHFVSTHSEDHRISAQYKETLYPLSAETDIVKRDIQLCEAVNGVLHVGHVSGAETLEAIRAAKSRGVSVTCEAAPHHFALNDTRVDVLTAQAKVNPPIRAPRHQEALIQAIFDGTVDIIATDHAPHDAASKSKPYSEAAYGISGIEVAFPIAYSTLVLERGLPLMRLIEMLTSKPAEIANLNTVGSIEPGMRANLTLVDLEAEMTVEPETFVSKGKNTPFTGMSFRGVVLQTIYNGQTVYKV